MDSYPFISTIIVTRNEQDYIKSSLQSLISQTYPKDRYEIIIVDGHSNDNTINEIQRVIEHNNEVPVRIIYNDKMILSSGWNIGIKESKGDYVVRIDAHAIVRRDFLKKNVQTIESVDAVCVGGKLITKSLEGDNQIISKVLSSPFGVGNSSFRVSNTAGYSDTAVYGLYRKKAIVDAGLFDERFVRNQDIELHSRIKRNGGKFYFNPDIVSEYYSRSTIKKMLKQAFENGVWNMMLLKHDFKSLSIRHLVPFAFVIFLIISIILGIICHLVWLISSFMLLFYFILGFVFAVKKTRKIKEIIVMPFLFFLLHISYGTGYLYGLFKRMK